jgi:flagellar M-ring protein FliF
MKGLTPSQVRASIVVPSSYYLQVWKEKNRPPDGSEPPNPDTNQLQEIESSVKGDIANAVAPLLPVQADGADPLSLVTVTTFQSLSPQPIPSPPLTEHALSWLAESWRTLAMLALAVFSLMMVRSMLKSISAPEALSAAAPMKLPLAAEIDAAESLEAEDEPTVGLAKRRFVKGPSYKDELAAMVRDDPDAAATILRNWIANAG